jgi:hypothetical protein
MERELKSIEWFMDNISRIVYSTSGCSCSVCHSIYIRGIKITDEVHANALFGFQHTASKRYFNSKEERVEYERSLKG